MIIPNNIHILLKSRVLTRVTNKKIRFWVRLYTRCASKRDDYLFYSLEFHIFHQFFFQKRRGKSIIYHVFFSWNIFFFPVTKRDALVLATLRYYIRASDKFFWPILWTQILWTHIFWNWIFWTHIFWNWIFWTRNIWT